MITKNGKYILNVEDFGKILKYYGLQQNSVTVQTIPGIVFTEYDFVDIFNDVTLVSFYDHDGKFRVSKGKNEFYEDDITNVLAKNPENKNQEMIDAISKRVHESKAHSFRTKSAKEDQTA